MEQVCLFIVLINNCFYSLVFLLPLRFTLVNNNLDNNGDDNHGCHDQPEIISIHTLQYYCCLFPLQQALQTARFPFIFAISDKNRLRKSKNDKKEKNVTNELVLVGRYVELRVKSHGESVAERWGAPYAGWSE